MLTEVCNFVHNYFEHTTYRGSFEIVDGNIDLSGMVLNGQRFRIVGSEMNDGIYTYHADGVYNDDDNTVDLLVDETFTGLIVAMSIPSAFQKIVKDISEWQEANKATLESPYTSESFGGYSYTKATGSGANSGGVLGWQDVFRSRLNAYRKIA